jgi:hypothetical protein
VTQELPVEAVVLDDVLELACIALAAIAALTLWRRLRAARFSG